MDEFTTIFGFSLIAVNLGMNLYSLINLDKVKKLIKYKVPDSNRILPVKTQNNNLKLEMNTLNVNEQEINEQEINEQEVNEQEVNEQKEEINPDNIDIEMGIIVDDEDVSDENIGEKKGLFSNWFN